MLNYSWIVSVLVLTNQAGALAAQPAHDAHAVSTMRNDAAPMINVQGTAKLGTTGLLKRVSGRRLAEGGDVDKYPTWLAVLTFPAVTATVFGINTILSLTALVKLLVWMQGKLSKKIGETLEKVPIKNSKKLNNWFTRYLTNMFIWMGVDLLTAPFTFGVGLSTWIMLIKITLLWGLLVTLFGTTSAIICHSYVISAGTATVTASFGIVFNLLIVIQFVLFLATAGTSWWSVPIALGLIGSFLVGKILDLISLWPILSETVTEIYTWLAKKA